MYKQVYFDLGKQTESCEIWGATVFESLYQTSQLLKTLEMEEWPWFWGEKKQNNDKENRETKDGFLRQIPLLSGFAYRQPHTSVYKLVKKLIWNLNPRKLLG